MPKINRIEKALIQELGNGRMDAEMQILAQEFSLQGIPVDTFTEKYLHRRQLKLTPQTLVAGHIPVVLGALKQLGLKLPQHSDYPKCLHQFLHRHIWESTVGRIIQRIYDDAPPVFVKPKGRKKRFTGHVFSSPSDLAYFQGASYNTPVFCSEIVEWLSEYRVFVIEGEIVGVENYAGNPAIKVDMEIIFEAVSLLTTAGEGTAAYGIDVGVLKSGITALVEWNDGFSLGSYGLNSTLYARLILTRWCELTKDLLDRENSEQISRD